MLRFFDNHLVQIITLLCILEACCEIKELTAQMKSNLKAWCLSIKGNDKDNHSPRDTRECCKGLGSCFEPYDPKKNKTSYCLVTSNSKENAEKVKQCCDRKKRRHHKYTGLDGNSIQVNTNKYVECSDTQQRAVT